MAQFIKKIQNFAHREDLWKKDSKILVGVSGGPDSVCLLEMLVFLAKKYNFQLQIAHVNYGLRGQDSKADELFVQALGKKHGLKVNRLKPKKTAYEGNLENALREIRYAYFEKLRQQLGFDLIAVGHNQNDQAETVLLKLLRGAGLNGLSAMKPKTEKIIRPLLQTSRQEILNYLKENEVPFCLDKTNNQNDFTRNKIRNQLIPLLEKDFNPAISETLSTLSYSIADDYAFISKTATTFVKTILKKEKAVFTEESFLALPPAIQRQALRQIFCALCKQSQDFSFQQIEELRKIIKSPKSKTQNASIGGLKISKKGATIEIFC
ncbi:MAG: tRNA lysidine(34) synthetase TilS [Candidatus Moraniibacteriota bacterium]